MKVHKEWVAVIDYFENINSSGSDSYVKIRDLLNEGENVLVLVKKQKGQLREDREKLAKSFWDLFPEESKVGKLIVSLVPDIKKITRVE